MYYPSSHHQHQPRPRTYEPALAVPCLMHAQHTLLDAADALYYHVPSFISRPRRKAFPTQLRLAMSLESSAYYDDLDRPDYMCHFDMEMSYRHCAQVIK